MTPTSDTQTMVAIMSSTIDLAMPRTDGSLSAGSGGSIGDGAGETGVDSSGGGDALCDLRFRVLSLFAGDDGRSVNRVEDVEVCSELNSVVRSFCGPGLLEDSCRW